MKIFVRPPPRRWDHPIPAQIPYGVLSPGSRPLALKRKVSTIRSGRFRGVAFPPLFPPFLRSPKGGRGAQGPHSALWRARMDRNLRKDGRCGISTRGEAVPRTVRVPRFFLVNSPTTIRIVNSFQFLQPDKFLSPYIFFVTCRFAIVSPFVFLMLFLTLPRFMLSPLAYPRFRLPELPSLVACPISAS